LPKGGIPLRCAPQVSAPLHEGFLNDIHLYLSSLGTASGARRSELDKEIAAIALPTLATLAADPLASLVDTAWLGRLGAKPHTTAPSQLITPAYHVRVKDMKARAGSKYNQLQLAR